MVKEMAMCAGIGLGCVGDEIGGFRIVSVEDLPEVDARMVRMEYPKNGAELIWMDRDDDNKTFAIAFKTVPGDDTGVAHIIEHSVLCGSGKYPVKEPFVDLLKSSFATFLNAWTGEDCTAYPVCSRNEKDFENLMDVYLDAVFDPASVKSPLAFRQEGWHWEIDGETGGLSRNGVVYSEMKGAYANPHRLALAELKRLMFAGDCYGYESGGLPEKIPELTFEGYCDFYRRHYHPSNARVFLDGRLDVRAALAKLDAYFSRYDRATPDVAVPLQAPRRVSKTVRYPLADGEPPEGKTILADGWLVGRFDDAGERLALNVLANALAGSNDDPVTKALLDRGLCEDVAMWPDANEQTTLTLLVENAADGKAEEIRSVVRETIASLCEKGLDKARLRAAADRMEFKLREKTSGSDPRGLLFFTSALDQWLYGGDPARGFKLKDDLALLRRRIEDGWFEAFLKRAVLDNPGRVEVTLVPDPDLAAKKLEAEREELAREKTSWTQEMLDAAKREQDELKKFQETPDSPENVAKLPVLRLEDIPEEGNFVKTSESPREPTGARLVRVKTSASGIVYVSLAFPLGGFSGGEIADLSFAADLYGELGAGDMDADAVRNAVMSELGRFSATVSCYSQPAGGDGTRQARAYLEVRAAALESKMESIAPLLGKILRETDFGDAARIGAMLTQARRAIEQQANGINAMKLARTRAMASVSATGSVADLADGIGQLRRLQKADDSFGEDGAEYCRVLGAAAKRAVDAGAAFVFVSDNAPADFAKSLARAFPLADGAGAVPDVAPLPARREGFVAAGRVASAAVASSTASLGGEGVVASRILSLGHLWTEVRVRGGAYGGSFARKFDGDAYFLSWNDPNAARTLDVYRASGDALRKAAEGDFEKYVIGAVAATEPYLTPSGEMEFAAGRTLSGRTEADTQKMRSEMLHTTKESLAAFAAEVDRMSKSGSVCVVGGREQIDACAAGLESVENVSK